MCGIAGFIDYDRNSSLEMLGKMSNVLAHRGPDDEGYFFDESNGFQVGLGHKRLSIIELSKLGHQPMHLGSLVIVYNGEIYNYIELRDELSKLGHKFITKSDTEVILHAYQQWGSECQNKLNGMWAFAMWDNDKKQLFLSRDRIGEKPLYYSSYNNSFVFGSEIKSLLSYGCPPTHNLELTELYLTLGYIPAPYTFYKNIHKLQAGHYLIATKDSVTEHQYWDLPMIDEKHMISDKKIIYENFETLLKDSIKIRMQSDVPYGAFLSGGLDSSGIVALMSNLINTPVQTFTIGFKEKAFDERNLAMQVAEKFKTNHLEFMVEPNVFDEEVNKIMYHFDEPFGDSSAIPTGYVSKIAAQKVKMVLTGDGGDEVLSGYESNRVEKFAEQYQMFPGFIRKSLPVIVSSAASLLNGNLRYKINRVAKAISFSNKSFDERLMAKSWCKPEIAEKLIKCSEKQIKLADFINNLYAKYPVKSPFYRLMYFQFKVLLPDDFLTKVDRMSMAYSLETRVPFLDYRLIEYMMKVTRDIKIEGYTRKSVLRNTIGKKLPSSLLNAPKRGFSIPLREWFKDKAFEQKLQSLHTSDFGLDPKLVKQFVDRNNSGKEDLGNFLWMLFIYKKWVTM
ncbi:MAG: asparagine synthase (glutamine-hydrolyzing) [Bacteroidota bacterium]